MKLLLVAATVAEIQPLINHFKLKIGNSVYTSDKFDLLITGVGMVATAFHLGRLYASNKYTLAINVGIAGSFNRNLELGQVIQVTEDCFAELGAEDGQNFITIEELGLGINQIQPILFDYESQLFQLQKVKGITVNTVHGNESTINQIQTHFNPDVESMEGAAFLYASNQSQTPSLQIRAISNYVEKRNRDNWKIDLAIANLNVFLIDFISKTA